MKIRAITAIVISAASCLMTNGCGKPTPKQTDELPASQTAAAPVLLKQTQCPVMGGDINKDIYVDVEGKRIYLCCKGCEEAVKKEPLKYIQQMTAAGIALESAPTAPQSDADQ